MKVKNIMFAGFAAAIFASVAGAANAATYNLASKEYVDTHVKKADANMQDDAAEGTFFSTVKQEDGVVDTETTAFIDNVANNPTSLIAPQTAAVKTYVDAQNELDEKVENKVKDAAALQAINDMTDETAKAEKKETSYTSVAVAEKIAADAAAGATGAIDMGPVTAEDGKYFKQIEVADGEMTTQQEAFVSDVEANPDSLVAPQTKAIKAYVDTHVKKADANMEDVAAEGTFFSTVKQEDGVVDTETTAFIDNVANNPTSLIAPQTAAVKTYVDDEIQKVNNGAAWLEENTASKQYIVQTDTDGNEVLVEIAIIGENGQPVYTEVKSAKNTDETTQG